MNKRDEKNALTTSSLNEEIFLTSTLESHANEEMIYWYNMQECLHPEEK